MGTKQAVARWKSAYGVIATDAEAPLPEFR